LLLKLEQKKEVVAPTIKKGGVNLPVGVVVTKRHKKGVELRFPRSLL